MNNWSATTIDRRRYTLGRFVTWCVGTVDLSTAIGLRDRGIYVQSGQQTIADYTSGTAATSPNYNYVYASYIDEPVVRDGTGGLRYYQHTQQYSVNALTDSSGTIKEGYAYDAYGNLSVFDGAGVATLPKRLDKRDSAETRMMIRNHFGPNRIAVTPA